MKTKEELEVLKEEVENLNRKLAELTEDELKQVTGGINTDLGVHPDESGIGTVSDENALPPDINSRRSL